MRLIDADAFKRCLQNYRPYVDSGLFNAIQTEVNQVLDCIEYEIDDAPSIDIEPKRGEWVGYNADKGDDWLRSDGEPIFLVCNKCHGTVMNNTSAHWNFCPNCGARMKGADDE